MHRETARRLIRLNNDFYRDNSRSFSATRATAWPGWERVLRSLPGPPRTVLDLACGNLRFKRFLDSRPGWAPGEYHAVDACRPLVPPDAGVAFHELDVLGLLVNEGSIEGELRLPPCDLVVCSGFMHHVPGHDLRRKLVSQLVSCAGKGGVVAVSFWRFADDPKLAARAQATTREAGDRADGLEAGDYLIGWNDEPGVFRYCHSFSDPEIDDMARAAAGDASVADRFDADGRNGRMNGYLILRRR